MTENGSEEEKDAPIEESNREPLPIWFFVGVILAVYGILILAGFVFGPETNTVLKELHPGLWWGSVMTVFGVLFAWFGWRLHQRDNG